MRISHALIPRPSLKASGRGGTKLLIYCRRSSPLLRRVEVRRSCDVASFESIGSKEFEDGNEKGGRAEE